MNPNSLYCLQMGGFSSQVIHFIERALVVYNKLPKNMPMDDEGCGHFFYIIKNTFKGMIFILQMHQWSPKDHCNILFIIKKAAQIFQFWFKSMKSKM